nr:MAG TPA: pentapeptide repeat protein [Caudoviricetes sp.]
MSIKYIKQSTVNRALRLHLRWLRNERHGKRLTVGLAISLKINWSKINLRSADLRSADLSSADLRYANLRSANLSSADLSSADLRWVSTINVEDLRVISCQLNTSDQNRNIAYYPDLNLITAGCFSGTLNELKERVKEVHEKDDPSIYAKYQAVFTFIETVLEIEKRRNNHERKQ